MDGADDHILRGHSSVNKRDQIDGISCSAQVLGAAVIKQVTAHPPKPRTILSTLGRHAALRRAKIMVDFHHPAGCSGQCLCGGQ